MYIYKRGLEDGLWKNKEEFNSLFDKDMILVDDKILPSKRFYIFDFEKLSISKKNDGYMDFKMGVNGLLETLRRIKINYKNAQNSLEEILDSKDISKEGILDRIAEIGLNFQGINHVQLKESNVKRLIEFYDGR